MYIEQSKKAQLFSDSVTPEIQVQQFFEMGGGGSYSPNDTASHPTILSSSAAAYS
jgi:hypothetical protein